MHKLVSAVFLALPFLAALPAHAAPDDSHFYAGIATGQSKSTLENAAGERFSSKNHPLPVKLYGGFALNEHFGLEAGVSGATGKYEFDRRLYGTAEEPRLSSRALYVALTGSVALGDRFGLHAKLGAAHSRFELSRAGARNGTISGTRPMVGVGASYKLTDGVAATLDLEHYGTVREGSSRLSKRQLQAGLKFGF